jgi:hypothetical protein
MLSINVLAIGAIPMTGPPDPGNPDVRPPFWRHRYYYLALKIGVLILAAVLALRLLGLWSGAR